MGSDSRSALLQLEDFLSRWRRFLETEEAKQADIFRGQVEHLVSGFTDAKSCDLEHERLYAPSFNLFRILLGKKTESGHSGFIAELLNPGGSHGQGSLFLYEFLKICEEAGIPVDPEGVSTAPDIEVQTERPIYNGRLDISLESAAASFLLVIENKIDAADQEDQLERYRMWLDKRKNVFRFSCLAYLAPQGRQPRCHGVSFVPLFYQEHIAPWLDRCSSLARPIQVRVAIIEYIKVLTALQD